MSLFEPLFSRRGPFADLLSLLDNLVDVYGKRAELSFERERDLYHSNAIILTRLMKDRSKEHEDVELLYDGLWREDPSLLWSFKSEAFFKTPDVSAPCYAFHVDCEGRAASVTRVINHFQTGACPTQTCERITTRPFDPERELNEVVVRELTQHLTA